MAEPKEAHLHRAADVLYLSLGAPRDDEGEDCPDGVVLRYGMNDDLPSGVTVIGYSFFGWAENRLQLAEIVANHLSVKTGDVISLIEEAEKESR